MKIHTLISVFTAVLLSVSCAKEADCPKPSTDIEISFTVPDGSIQADVQTRASAVTTLSSFNVHCFTLTAGSSESSVFNVSFSGTTSYTGTTSQYWPSTDSGYRFYASNATISPASSGASISASNSTDIVVAKCLSPVYRQSNSLSFEHIFARVGAVSVCAPLDGSTVSDLSISFTPKVSGTYAINSGVWSSTVNGPAVTLAASTGSNASTDTYCVPGIYTLSASYTLTKGAYSQSFTKSATVTFPAGKISTVSTTIPDSDASEIAFTVTVSAWGTNDVSPSWN